MKKVAVAAAAAAACAFGAPAFAESSVLGTWNTVSETPRGTRESTLTFTETDGEYAVEVSSDGPMQIEGEVSELEVTDHSFSFVRTMNFQDSEFSITYAGTVEGDTLTGTITTQMGESSFTGTRAAAE